MISIVEIMVFERIGLDWLNRQGPKKPIGWLLELVAY
jgi:hypothetical protein